MSAAPSTLAALRRDLALATSPFSSRPAPQIEREGEPFYAAAGLVRGTLHEIAAACESDMAAAAGFALALAARCTKPRAIFWVSEDMACAESGALYGPGLDDLALAPERLIVVKTARCRDVLWAMEEALRCRAVGAAIGEVRGAHRGIDLTASRRLSLAANHSGSLALLLRPTPGTEPSAAATRWIVGAAPSAAKLHAPGPPRVQVRLARNRYGRPGSWLLEWNSDKHCFDPAPENRESVA
jgi:protein ImuA